MRPASNGSLEKSRPGTMCAVQNATCSVSAKKLSGLRFSTMRPTGCTGTSSSGTSLVASSTSKLNLSACFSVNSCTPSSYSGYAPASIGFPQVATMKVRIRAADLHGLIPVQRVGAGHRTPVKLHEGGLRRRH